MRTKLTKIWLKDYTTDYLIEWVESLNKEIMELTTTLNAKKSLSRQLAIEIKERR